MNIPLVDLKAQYQSIKSEMDAAIERCLTNTSFIGGPDSKSFATEFAEFCGGGHVALCGNGTDAIQLALVALLGKGDGTGEVITVSHTFIATAEAISTAGYRPVFVDVDPRTLLMDPAKIEAAITPATRAIVPVHLYGQMADMEAICAIAKRHNLMVVEDAAQAHGASFKGRGPGQWGDMATFSFYPGKNLGAYGDAGAVFSTDQKLIEYTRQYLDHGRLTKYEHAFEGVSSRLDGLQAAVLRVKLPHLSGWNQRRREIAALYDRTLAGHACIKPVHVHPEAVPVYHLYVVQLLEADRDAVFKTMREQGIEVGIHYPIPLHMQPAYQYLGYAPEALPVTRQSAQRILSLPLYPEMSDDQAAFIAEQLIRLVAA